MSLLEVDLPLAVAPMAGGPSTPALAAAVTTAGGFAFWPGGYLTAPALEADLAAARASGRPFGVNLFVPQQSSMPQDRYDRYRAALAPEAALFDVDLPAQPRHDDDAWRAKLEVLLAAPPPVVSLTFGLPDRADIAALRRAGSAVLATVTTTAEASAAEDAGVDGLVVQGPSAGGHSGAFDATRAIDDADTADVVRAVGAITRLPIIAAGGVDSADAVHNLLAAGAEGVSVGTLFLRSDEAGTSSTHRAALADPSFTSTVVTRCFTGRPARALRNDFIERHHATAPTGYPAIHHLTRDLRRAAGRTGDAQHLHLWAGTGWGRAEAAPAAEIVRALTAGL